MKNIGITILIIFTIISCHFLGPIDSDINTKNIDFTDEDVIGIWELDKFSYKFLLGKENFDSIYITFKNDSTFEMNNSKFLFRFEQNKYSNEKLSDTIGIIDNIETKGRWEIHRYEETNYNYIVLDLIYDDKSIQEGLKIYKKDKNYQIWYFFGDPDEDGRLRFLKR